MAYDKHFPLWLAGALWISQSATAQQWVVSHPGDSGPGSLVFAIEQANQRPGEDHIRFVSDLFQEPYTLRLSRPLPVISDTLTIDGYIPDRLWSPSGITLDAHGRFPLFRIAPDTTVTLRHLTLTQGKAEQGGAIYSEGNLILDSLLIMDSEATQGGGIYQQGGQLVMINSTLLGNRALQQGGALYSERGELVLTHNTITTNQAAEGAGLYRVGPLTLGNNILAHNQPGHDAVCAQTDAPDTTANLIMTSSGCGSPAFTEDPRLDVLGYYNGPTETLPLRGNSPVINQADNRLSVDAAGNLLVWDQRGNGDPRFAAGIADMGAFEKQAVIQLQVDTLSDEDVRRCSTLSKDCSLRGALALLNASRQLNTLSLDPQVFAGEMTLELSSPLPLLERNATLHLKPGQTLEVKGYGGIQTTDGVTFTVRTQPAP